MNYFKGIGRVLEQTFTGLRDRNGRIASLKQLRARRPQLAVIVFGPADDDTTRAAAVEDAQLAGYDIFVASDHLELFAPLAKSTNQ